MHELPITMKNLIFSIALLIFLHTSSTNYMASADFLLYDTGMEHLVADTAYYMVPVVSGEGGGLYQYESNNTCYVVQQPIDDLPNSVAVIFNHDKPEDYNWVTSSKDLNIRFDRVIFCDGSSSSSSSSSAVLKVNDKDEATGKYFITTGGVAGNPGCGTINSWFRIEKIDLEYSYKLVFCPSVCDLVNVTCSDVGALHVVGPFQRLGLSDYPLLVRFHKADPCQSNKL